MEYSCNTPLVSYYCPDLCNIEYCEVETNCPENCVDELEGGCEPPWCEDPDIIREEVCKCTCNQCE